MCSVLASVIGIRFYRRCCCAFDERLRLAVLLLVSALLFAATNVSAAPGVWSTNGPDGGGVGALAIDPTDPDNLYASVSFGALFRSIDGGASWIESEIELELFRDVETIEVDPSDSRNVYLGSFGGVWKSTDQGASWAESSVGLPSALVFDLLIDPATPTTIYAATFSGVYKSDDSGALWRSVSNGLGGAFISAMAMQAGSSAAVLFAAGEGVFKSADGGATWVSSDQGLPDVSIEHLVVDPSSPMILYAGSPAAGVHKSDDGGATWAPINSGLTNTFVRGLIVDPSRPGVLYAGTQGGAFKSVDGASWTPVDLGFGPENVGEFAINPLVPDIVYLATTSIGVLKTEDGGDTWSIAASGLRAVNVTALAVVATTSATVYAGTSPGAVFKSLDAGESWFWSGSLSWVRSLAIHPNEPDTVYAGTATGIHKSNDGGRSWDAVNSGISQLSILSVAIDPFDSNTLYAGSGVARNDGNVFKSVDAGASWLAMNNGLPEGRVNVVFADPSVRDVVYAGTGGDGLFRTVDGGNSWTRIDSDPVDPFVTSIAVDPTISTTLYVGSLSGFFGGGLFRSSDGGASWSRAETGLTTRFISSLSIDPAAPARMFAGTDRSGIFMSADAAQTWSPLNAGLELPTSVVSPIAFDPTRPGRAYAGVLVSGVYSFDEVCADDLVCDDGNECTVDTCDLGSGACRFQSVNEGLACADGGGICRDGLCASGTPVSTPTMLATSTATSTATSSTVMTPASTPTASREPTQLPTATPTSSHTPTVSTPDSRTPTETPEATSSATATVTEQPTPSCAGDCDGNGMVSISELVRGVNIALLRFAADACLAFDVNGNGIVSISELVRAVNAALSGCPAAGGTPTPITPATSTSTPTSTFPTSTPGAARMVAAIGGEFQVNTYTTGFQTFPAIASNSAGGFVVVWDNLYRAGASQDGDGSGIFGQRFDQNGGEVGSEFQANTFTIGDQVEPDIAHYDNGFAVAWVTDATPTFLSAQRFRSDGASIGEEFEVHRGVERFFVESGPSVGSWPDGRLVVVWTSTVQGVEQVVGRRIDTQRGFVGAEFVVASAAEGPVAYPNVAVGEDGSFAVVWERDLDRAQVARVIEIRLYDVNGVALGSAVRLSGTGDLASSPVIVKAPGGGFIATWSTSTDGPSAGSAILVRRLAASGVPLGTEFRADSEDLGYRTASSVAASSEGFFVVWETDGGLLPEGSDDEGIYGHAFDLQGNRVGSEFHVNTFSEEAQASAALTSTGPGAYVVVWSSEDQDGDADGIFGQRFGPTSESKSATGR